MDNCRQNVDINATYGINIFRTRNFQHSGRQVCIWVCFIYGPLSLLPGVGPEYFWLGVCRWDFDTLYPYQTQ